MRAAKVYVASRGLVTPVIYHRKEIIWHISIFGNGRRYQRKKSKL